MYNPLNKYPRVREAFLFVQWLTTGLTTVGSVVLIGLYGLDNVPGWFTITVGALAALWTYTGLTAQGNVTGTDANGYKLGEAAAHE